MNRSTPLKRTAFKAKAPPRREAKQLDYHPRPRETACRIEGLEARACVAVPKVKIERSEAYRRLVAAMPCANCGLPGRSQCAHANFGKALASKTDDRFSFPLCGPGSVYCGIAGSLWGPGCHALLDQGALFPKAVRREKEALWGKQTRAAIRAAGAWPKNLEPWPGDEGEPDGA